MYNNKKDFGDIDASESMQYFKNSQYEGKEWVSELIKSMSLWTLEEEVYDSKHNKYLIDGEAFDWLLLARRLLDSVGDLVPTTEKNRLLLSEDISDLMSQDEFRNLLGPEKYSAYLNYWYGIVVEEAVIRNAEEEEGKGMPRSGKFGKAPIARGSEWPVILVKDYYYLTKWHKCINEVRLETPENPLFAFSVPQVCPSALFLYLLPAVVPFE